MICDQRAPGPCPAFFSGRLDWCSCRERQRLQRDMLRLEKQERRLTTVMWSSLYVAAATTSFLVGYHSAQWF